MRRRWRRWAGKVGFAGGPGRGAGAGLSVNRAPVRTFPGFVGNAVRLGPCTCRKELPGPTPSPNQQGLVAVDVTTTPACLTALELARLRLVRGRRHRARWMPTALACWTWACHACTGSSPFPGRSQAAGLQP